MVVDSNYYIQYSALVNRWVRNVDGRWGGRKSRGTERSQERHRERETGVDFLVLWGPVLLRVSCCLPALHWAMQRKWSPTGSSCMIWGELEKDAPFLRYFTAICWETVIITMWMNSDHNESYLLGRAQSVYLWMVALPVTLRVPRSQRHEWG